MFTCHHCHQHDSCELDKRDNDRDDTTKFRPQPLPCLAAKKLATDYYDAIPAGERPNTPAYITIPNSELSSLLFGRSSNSETILVFGKRIGSKNVPETCVILLTDNPAAPGYQRDAGYLPETHETFPVRSYLDVVNYDNLFGCQ